MEAIEAVLPSIYLGEISLETAYSAFKPAKDAILDVIPTRHDGYMKLKSFFVHLCQCFELLKTESVEDLLVIKFTLLFTKLQDFSNALHRAYPSNRFSRACVKVCNAIYLHLKSRMLDMDHPLS